MFSDIRIKTLDRRFELDPTGWDAITCQYISRDNGQTGVKTETNPSENRIRYDVG